MEKVYIISRYQAPTERGREFNRQVARYFCKQIINEGKAPVAPHLFYTQFLDDDLELERMTGLAMGIFELRQAQEFLLVVIDGIISEGMRREIEEVSRLGISGRIVCMTRQEIREVMKVIV